MPRRMVTRAGARGLRWTDPHRAHLTHNGEPRGPAQAGRAGPLVRLAARVLRPVVRHILEEDDAIRARLGISDRPRGAENSDMAQRPEKLRPLHELRVSPLRSTGG